LQAGYVMTEEPRNPAYPASIRQPSTATNLLLPRERHMNLKKNFLIATFAMIMGVALLSGVNPQWFARTFLGIAALDINIAHIVRAVMGLYMAMSCFWLYAAFHPPYRNIAVLTVAIFAGGVFAGRILSLALDGPPAPLLIFYIVVELALAPLAYWVFTRDD
jgi:hypothetical protein